MRGFSTAGNLVMDFGAGTCSTAEVCMLIVQHSKFLGCTLNPEVLVAAEPYLVLTLAFQVLNPKSDISESVEVEAAAKVFADEPGAFLA